MTIPVNRRIDFSSEELMHSTPVDDIRPTLVSSQIKPQEAKKETLDSIQATPLKVVTPEIAAVAPDNAKYCKNYWLGLSYIPIIGTLPSIISQCVLAGKLKKAMNSTELTPLLTRINQFKVASITRTILTLAAVISVLAFGLFTGGLPLAMGLGFLATASTLGFGLATFHAIQLHTNKAEIKSLEIRNK